MFAVGAQAWAPGGGRGLVVQGMCLLVYIQGECLRVSVKAYCMCMCMCVREFKFVCIVRVMCVSVVNVALDDMSGGLRESYCICVCVHGRVCGLCDVCVCGRGISGSCV